MIAAIRYGENTVKGLLSLGFLLRMLRTYDLRFLRWGLSQIAMLSPAAMHALLGYSALVYGLLYGYRTVIAERFQPAKVLALIEQAHVNTLMATPTMIAALLLWRCPSCRTEDGLRHEHRWFRSAVVACRPAREQCGAPGWRGGLSPGVECAGEAPSPDPLFDGWPAGTGLLLA